MKKLIKRMVDWLSHRTRLAGWTMPKRRTQPGVFTISVDDGWIEYSFDVNIGGHYSIARVQMEVCEALKVSSTALVIRQKIKITNV